MHNALPFRSTSMLMFGHLVRKIQENDLNDDFEFSCSCRKRHYNLVLLLPTCGTFIHCQKRSSSISMTLSISRTKKVSIK